LASGHAERTPDISARAALGDATAWIDSHAAPLGAEPIPLAEAAGRVLAQGAIAAVDLPSFDRAAIDGLAVCADDTAGASAYNPLSGGNLVSAGDPLPAAADAIVPVGRFERGPAGNCEIIDAVAPGSGIERKGSHFVSGATLLKAGRRILDGDIGLLAAAGVAHLHVIGRPRVRCFVVARAATALEDANGPLLRALIERDGGIFTDLRHIARDRAAIAAALARADADVILVAGGTGWGPDDATAAALAEAGELAIHGVAVNPGESVGLGRTDTGAPVFLLPGAPAACLWAYEFFAGRAIRRLGGRNPALPYRLRDMTTARKIVSSIGMTEIYPVRCLSHDRVEPVASFAEAGIGALARADGFVIMPEGSEGVPEGAVVTVHLREDFDMP
jgi:molybdopterin molybdotransferase